MAKSENIGNIAVALAKAQGEMKAVVMNATNPFLKNRYADLGAIIETSKPVLAKNELSFTQIVSNENGEFGVETILMHSSGEWISSSIHLPAGEEKGKNLAQVVGSVITYLRRYSLSAILGIHTEEDSDGNGKKEKDKVEETEEDKKKTEALKVVKDTIMKKCVDLGGAKNDELKKLLKSYHPSGNFNKIDDEEKLKELLEKLNSMDAVKGEN